MSQSLEHQMILPNAIAEAQTCASLGQRRGETRKSASPTAKQKSHGAADVLAGTFRLQHRGVGALGARSPAHAGTSARFIKAPRPDIGPG